MKTKRLTLFFLLAIGATILSACTGAPLSNTWPGLAADEQRAYVSSGSFIYAVDLQNGREVWRYPAEADSKRLFFANAVITEDRQLLIGSAGTSRPFVSLDPETGAENWTEPFLGAKGAWVAPPLVMDDVIYAPNTDGFLYLLDMRGRAIADPIELGGALWSKPVTDGILLYATSLDHHLHVIDPVRRVANSPVNLGGAAPGSPVIWNNSIYAGSFASTLVEINPYGGNEIIAQADNWIWGTPVLDGETLYYADLSGKVYSLDLATGRQNWDRLQPNGPIVASLLVVGNRIYVATEAGPLLALDRDGNIVWEKTPGGSIYTTPVVSGDLILVAPYQAEFALAAYDADGRQAWTFTPGK